MKAWDSDFSAKLLACKYMAMKAINLKPHAHVPTKYNIQLSGQVPPVAVMSIALIEHAIPIRCSVERWSYLSSLYDQENLENLLNLLNHG